MLSDYLYEFDSTDLAIKNCGPCRFAFDNVISSDIFLFQEFFYLLFL